MTDRRDPDEAGDETRPIDLSHETGPDETGPDETGPDETGPVEVADRTAPFAPVAPSDDPAPLVSPTAANRLIAAATPPDGGGSTGGIDALFAASRFHDDEAAPPTAPTVLPGTAYERAAPRPPAPSAPPHRHLTRLQRTLLGVTGGLLALVVLAALFFLGTRLPAADALPSPSATPPTTPTPVPTVLPPGPVAVGVHRWDQLLGGECLSDFTGPWAERYTVVDCATPHAAQLVFRGRFADPATPGYPGEAALQSQMSVLCSAPGVIDLAAASQYTDAQIEASFAASAAQWDAGDHWYYCFVTRASTQPLTGSVAVARG